MGGPYRGRPFVCDAGRPGRIGEVLVIEPVLVQFVDPKTATGPILTDRKRAENTNSYH